MFTKSEVIVIKLVLKGFGNKQMSDILCVANDTIKAHLRGIFKKARVHTKPEFISSYYQFLLKSLSPTYGPHEMAEKYLPPFFVYLKNKSEGGSLPRGANADGDFKKCL